RWIRSRPFPYSCALAMQGISRPMTTEPGSSATEDAAEQRKNAGDSRPSTRESLRSIRDGIVVMWWAFFDWLAVVSWKTLLIVYGLGLVLAAMLNRPNAFLLFVVASAIIKVVAGGKRRAELTANEATERAETEQLERTVLE